MKKITELPHLATADGNDILVLVDTSANETVYITKAEFLNDAIDTINLKDDSVTPAKLAPEYVASNASSSTGVIASATFASTNSQLTLPSAGVWVINTSVRCSMNTASAWLELRLFNITTGVDADSILGHSDFISGLSPSATLQPTASKQVVCVTTSPNNIIQLQARKGSGDATVTSDDNGRTGMLAFRIG